MREINDPEDLKALIGTEFGVSDWYQIRQVQIKQFAQATGDFQWIHLDPERCEDESPFGKPISHGYLILSLLPKFFYEVFSFSKAALTINYGLNKVRFTHPVAVDSNIRARFTLNDLKELEKGVRIFTQTVFEIQDIERPACIAESILQIVWE